MALPRDAKHDFYAIAGGESIEPGVEALGNSELWAEAVFIVPAGRYFFLLFGGTDGGEKEIG